MSPIYGGDLMIIENRHGRWGGVGSGYYNVFSCFGNNNDDSCYVIEKNRKIFNENRVNRFRGWE